MNMTIKEAVNLASKKLNHIEAIVLLQYILNMDKKYIIINSDKMLSKNQEDQLIKNLNKLENGIPLQYITSKAYFMGLEFYVNENVLIPQPDTEILVEEALKVIRKSDKDLKILDLCTGTGCIAISIAKYEKNVQIYGTDISREALKVAEINYKNLLKSGINTNENEIIFFQSDMFNNIKERFDVIVCNPPYIKVGEIKSLSQEVQNEPKIALDGGADGLKYYRIIRNNIQRFLNKNGTLLMEIGYNQREAVQGLFENSSCIKDLSGNDRVVIWRN